MTKIKVLVEGYVRKEKDVELASSTVTLIQENKLNILIDPGMDRPALLNALNKERISPDKIGYIVLTHYHLDHSLLAGIFENAKVMDFAEIYSFDGKITTHSGKIPGTSIEIIKTPGHDMFHCSVLAKTKELGNVAIVGDVFWWNNNQKQTVDADSLMKHEDPYVKNKEDLTASRKKVLEFADYIIPGHGKMFKVKK